MNLRRVALLTGSMNPFTKGHKHVVDVSLLLFDSIIVAIGTNPAKSGGTGAATAAGKAEHLFTDEQRHRMTKTSLAEYRDRVSVRSFTGAAIDFAREVKATAIVRGLRDETDQAYEASMSHANGIISKLEHGAFIPTIYIPCPPSLSEVSSSLVRELIQLRRSRIVLDEYVLPAVADVVENEIYD